jgi:hypothetical protein
MLLWFQAAVSTLNRGTLSPSMTFVRSPSMTAGTAGWLMPLMSKDHDRCLTWASSLRAAPSLSHQSCDCLSLPARLPGRCDCNRYLEPSRSQSPGFSPGLLYANEANYFRVGFFSRVTEALLQAAALVSSCGFQPVLRNCSPSTTFVRTPSIAAGI